MPDVKISALPAATTPLAGTEVLPIVQSSTTKKVSVADLTAGRAISASSITNSALTSGRVTYAGASGLLTDSANLLYSGTDLTVYGLTVGRGPGASIENTTVGSAAFSSNSSGTQNVAVGRLAMQQSTSSSFSVAVGNAALQTLSTGSNNTAVGASALNANTTASNNTAVGYQAGFTNITGTGQTFLGQNAGRTSNPSATTGYNTIIGNQAGYYLTTGVDNTFIGSSVGRGSGQNMTTGSKNTIIGTFDGNENGLDIRTASNYIVLSDGSGVPRGVFDSSGNFIVAGTTITNLGTTNTGFIARADGAGNVYAQIASTGTGAQSAAVFYNGNGAVGSISTSGTLTSYNVTSDYRLKENIVPMTGALAKVAQLKPVTYKWKIDGSDGQGFIAHELAEIMPDCITGEKDAIDSDGKPKYQGMDTSFLVATLVSAIQELKAEFDAYKATHP